LVKSLLEDAGDSDVANVFGGVDRLSAAVACVGNMTYTGLFTTPEPCDRLRCPSLILLLAHWKKCTAGLHTKPDTTAAPA